MHHKNYTFLWFFLLLLLGSSFSIPSHSTHDDVRSILSLSKISKPSIRDKRSLFLKKKILGAGIFGFGLGIGLGALKGYKYGSKFVNIYPPIVERPVHIERPYYVERPIYYSTYPRHEKYHSHSIVYYYQ